jgi:predicted RND superfamily exporter protein/outer membrane lipoprotein-sorting protein
MDRFYRIVTERPALTLAAVLLATLYVGSGVRFLETLNNQDSELPKSDPIVRTNDRLKAVFGDKADLLIGIEADDIFTPGTLRKVMELSEELKGVEGVIEDEIVSLSAINNIEGSEWGLEVGPIIEELPETPEAIAELKAAVRANPLLDGKLVSKDGTLTLIQANVEKGHSEDETHRQVFALVGKFSGPERIHVAGGAIQPPEVDYGIQNDLRLLLPIVLVMTLIGFYLCFRTWRGVWLPFSVVVLSVLWTMGLTGHVGLPVTVVASAVPILMVAISSSYGIHVLHHYYEAVRHREPQPVRATLEKVAPSIAMVGVVSALGSASLLTFPVTSIRQFGIITTMGVLAAAAVCLTYTPAMLGLLKRKAPRVSESTWSDDRLAGIARFSVRHRKAVLAVAMVTLIVSAVGISRIEIGTDIIRYFPQGHRLRAAFDVFNDRLGGVRRVNVMVEGAEPEAIKDPALLLKIQRFQEYAESLPFVGATSSFADIIRRIHQEMNGGDPAYHVIPESRELVAQYLLLYSISGDPSDFEEIVDYDYQRTKIRIMLSASQQKDHRQLYESLQAYAAKEMGPGVSVEFGGDVMFWLAQMRHIAVGKIYNILTGIAFVVLFCGLTFRSVTAGFLSIFPLVISTALTFGLMGFVGIRLEASTAILTSVAVGVGVDFALHYLINFRQELQNAPGEIDIEEIATRVFMIGGKPILFDMVSNILGFSVLMFSAFLPVRYFGWLISLTMLTVGIATLLVMPALIAVLRPRFLLGRRGVAPAAPADATESNLRKSHVAVSSLVLFALLNLPQPVSAQAPNGKQIIERNDAMRSVDDEQVELEMQLINKRGQKRERRVSWVLKNDAQRNQKGLIRFTAPADVRGTSLLSIENADREDDQWLYLPALRKSRRISAANISDSFVGSDFAYEDLGAEEIDQHDYRLVRDDTVDSAPVWVVEATPNSEQRRRESGYSRREIFVRKDNAAIARIDYYDRQKELLKVLRTREIHQVPSTKTWRAQTIEMTNQKTGHTTVIVYGPFVINKGISDDTFSIRELERER